MSQILIHFNFEGNLHSMVLDTSPSETSLTMIKARIYRKLALDEREVKLQLSYVPLLVGCEKEFVISDDEDVYGYLISTDKDMRRCELKVKGIPILEEYIEPPEKLSRVAKSDFGTNYDNIDPHAEGIEGNAIVLYVDENRSNRPNDATNDCCNEKEEGANIGANTDNHECEDSSRSDTGDEYREPPPNVEASEYTESWEDELNFVEKQEFPNKRVLLEVVDRAAFVKCFGYNIKKSDRVRLVLKCEKEGCEWGLRAARIAKTDLFSIRRHTKIHTCSRSSQSSGNSRRKGTPELVASLLHDDYPGQMGTPSPKVIMDLVQTKLGVKISYSTALRGKIQAVNGLRGSPEESYKLLHCYLHVLMELNPGTITSVKLDDDMKFRYLFIALGASIEGFQTTRKVIIVDATHLKNGYGGTLVFASAQDGNRHVYPLAFGVIDSENNASWTWFFEMLKSCIADSSELVFMTDRNASLITAIATVYPQAHHGYCVWHLSQNVKSNVSNVNKDVVAWRFIEMSKYYTEVQFDNAYSSFKIRYPSAAAYLEESTQKEKWARCHFPGQRYNLDTSNCAESLNNVFREARRYSLIPLIDAIIKKLSAWFNERRKIAVSGPAERKLVPYVENHLHNLWSLAERLIVTDLNSFELEYQVVGSDGKPYLVNLILKSCSCREFDVDKYPCVHAVAAFIRVRKGGDRGRDMEIHDLCSKFFLTETWAMSYYRTIYLMPDKSQWNVPDCVKELKIEPPARKSRVGRKRTKRFPSVGEKRPRTKNKRRGRLNCCWLLFGDRNFTRSSV